MCSVPLLIFTTGRSHFQSIFSEVGSSTGSLSAISPVIWCAIGVRSMPVESRRLIHFPAFHILCGGAMAPISSHGRIWIREERYLILHTNSTSSSPHEDQVEKQVLPDGILQRSASKSPMFLMQVSLSLRHAWIALPRSPLICQSASINRGGSSWALDEPSDERSRGPGMC